MVVMVKIEFLEVVSGLWSLFLPGLFWTVEAVEAAAALGSCVCHNKTHTHQKVSCRRVAGNRKLNEGLSLLLLLLH